jgi:hypothetical protein
MRLPANITCQRLLGWWLGSSGRALPSKHEDLSSNNSTEKKIKIKKKIVWAVTEASCLEGAWNPSKVTQGCEREKNFRFAFLLF